MRLFHCSTWRHFFLRGWVRARKWWRIQRASAARRGTLSRRGTGVLSSTRAKLLAVFASFLLLVTASVVATWLSVGTQATDGLVINLAGRQRMLTQKMTKAVLGTARGQREEYQSELTETVEIFDQALVALLDGGRAQYGNEIVDLPPTTDTLIRSQLQAVVDLWRRFRREVEALQVAEQEGEVSLSAVREIEALSPVILEEMDSAVRMYEAAAGRKLSRLHIIQALFFTSAVGLLFTGYRLTQRTIVRPFSDLEAASQRVARGDLEGPIMVVSGASSEVLALGRSLENMRHELVSSGQQLRRSAADLHHNNQELDRVHHELRSAEADLVEKERLEREMEVARELQQSILPQRYPAIPGFSCAARSRPARWVGGDFYDIIQLDNGSVGLVMADVSGKGIPAALYGALTRSLIHAEAKRGTSPRDVLLSVHRLLLEMTQADMFVTVFYGVLDPVRGILRYVRAGHDRPLLLRPSTGRCQLMAPKGMLLGILEQVRLEEAEEDLLPGDLLVIYSDGITEATSSTGEFFDVERLCETVRAAAELGVEELCQHIFDRVDRFQAGAAQHDDMTLMVVQANAEGR